MLKKVEREYPRAGIHGRVVHEIGREIVSGVLKQGERLPNEIEFITRFNGSRTAIREAFRVLSAKGLLEAKQRSGTRVRSRAYWNLWDPDVLSWHDTRNLDKQTVHHLFELRAIVEPEAARLLSEKSGEGLGTVHLEKICLTMERAWDEGNIEKVRESEMAFHLCLIESCGNEFLERARDAVRLILAHCQAVHAERSDESVGTARWYSLIVEKVNLGDAVGAANAVRSLVARDLDLLVRAGNKAIQKESAVA